MYVHKPVVVIIVINITSEYNKFGKYVKLLWYPSNYARLYVSIFSYVDVHYKSEYINEIYY